MGTDCNFCGGKGKVGSNDCVVCDGERRILGKQKLKGIRLKKKEKAHKVDFMGHVSKEDKDIYGHLWVVKKD
jgi:DnaJ-class molecular chaperone